MCIRDSTVKIADESSENILGIDFLQKFRLHLDPRTKEITFQSAPSRALFATKNFTIPPFATTMVQARTFQNIDRQLHYNRRHRRTKATLDIRTLNTSQLRQQKSVYYANPELRSARGQYQHRRHTRHPEYRKRGTNSLQR